MLMCTQRIAALKFGKNIGKQVEAGGFVGAENDRALHDVAAVRDHLDGFVAQAEKFLGVFEEHFTGGSQLERTWRSGREAWALYACSSWRICALTADCERNTFWPAREKLLSLAT